MKAFLPDQTRLSQVHLRTARLEPALEFYSGVLGLHVVRSAGRQAYLASAGQAQDFIVLSEDLTALPSSPRSTGLYHLAIRYPRRQDLARAYWRLRETGYLIDGASDQGVSEAIYLSDPDGNGVELYADRPRAQWPWHNGQVAMETSPLDLKNLLATIDHPSKSEPPARTDLGHLHLHVADLAAAERFYSEFLGLAVTQRDYPGALFFSAGGYHHHIAVNTWAQKAPALRNSTGLVSYRFEVPVAEISYCLRHRAPLLGYHTRNDPQDPTLLQIRDPNGNWLEIQSSASQEVARRQPCKLLSKVAKLSLSPSRQR